jgi:hypothetical protein
MDSSIQGRIDRLFDAVSLAVEQDLSKFKPVVVSNQHGHGVYQDYNGGATEAELSNKLHILIHNVASFHDHLKKWAPSAGVNRENVHSFLKASVDFCIVRDLWNNDKHGYPPKEDRDWSRKAPRLRDVHGALQAQTRPEKNSQVWMTIDAKGKPIYGGDGTFEVVISGTVVDRDGNPIGTVDTILSRAVARCEEAIKLFGAG